MKKHFIAIALGLTLSANAMADEQQKNAKRNEAIGLGSGIVVGAAVAGPAGAIVAGLFGLLIADDVNDENKLAQAHTDLANQDQQMDALNQELAMVRQQTQVQLVSMEQQIERVSQAFESNIQFRTASAALEQGYQSQLNLLAQNLNENKDLSLILSGYADKRGDSTYNKNLSSLRVEAIKEYLLAKGVDESRVKTFAYGEQQSTHEVSNEANFFDRRVLIKVTPTQHTLTAAN